MDLQSAVLFPPCISALRDVGKRISIGSAIANTFTYILDETSNPCLREKKVSCISVVVV